MKTIKIDLTEKLRPLFKSVRKAGRVIKEEAVKASATIKDIEAGKLKIVATLSVTKNKKPSKS